MTPTLTWRDHTIAIRYSRRKTVALHVKQGNIEIRAPYHTDQPFLEAFLHSRSLWLEKALQEQAQKARDRIDYSLANRIPFMGFDVSIHRQGTQSRASWALTSDGLLMSLPDPEDPAMNLATLIDFYKAQARFWLPKKTQETAQRAQLSDRLKDVRLRKTKTKWGHCTHDGRIQYNWLIMMAPETIIDYLVSHEVSHLRHLNHSAAFWHQVSTLHPSYLADRKWLRQNEHRLSLQT